MRRVCLLVLAMLLAGGGGGLVRAAGGAEPVALDLPQAIERAIRFNQRLARAGIGVDQARLAVDDAEADFSFRLTPRGTGSLGDTRDQWQAGLDVSRKLPSGAQITAGALTRETRPRDGVSSWRTSVRVDVRQPLFSQFGSFVQREKIRQADEQLDRERRLWEQQKIELVIELTKTFEELTSLQQQIRSDEAFFERTDKLYRLTLMREEQGRSTRIDTLRVELQRGQAQARLENNRERYFTRSRDLAELIGLDQDAAFDLIPPPLPDIELPDLETALQVAFEHRLDYAQALADVRTRKRQVELARRNLLPDVALVVAAERFGEDATSSGAFSMEESAWTIGLTGDTDLLKRRERNALERSLIEEQSAREALAIRRNAITREVLQELSRYRRTASEARIQERNHQLAESRVLLSQRLYEAGRVDNFSVTDAEDALFRAETALLNARSDWLVASYTLLKQLGVLLEAPDDLTPRESSLP